ncbi:MAG: DUF2207 domain-containing protein [Candidatus Kerfeldbacteria bacterium]
MKIITKLVLIFILLFIPTMTLGLNTGPSGEQIDQFYSVISINQDSSITVVEHITYNFEKMERHGIYRTIPYSYERDGYKYNLRINVLSVVDENNNFLTYTVSKSSGEFEIKIGDADKYVSGVKNYVIEYKVDRAINYFEDYDEFYWNVTGNEWYLDIKKSGALVSLSENISNSELQTACYTGIYGSEEQDCTVSNIDEGIEFSSNSTLSSDEGLTVVFGWPKGITIQPDGMQLFLWFMQDNWPIFFPLLIFIVMYFLWYTRGRDPEVRDTIIPIYESPNKMTAGELGTIVDEKVDLKDISATIIQLAVKGYIKIKEIDLKKLIGKSKDYELIKLKDSDGSLIEFEKLVLEGIFGKNDTKKVSALKNKFYTHLPGIKKSIYELVVTNDYFPANPDKVRTMYGSIGAISIIIVMFILAAATSTLGTLTFVSIGVGVAITIIFAFIMPRKTIKGAETHSKILGFKWFLSVTETERLKFHNSPTKSPKSFEENLPYAMVLGVEKEWAGQFDDIYLTPPDWYEGNAGNVFGALYLANSLSSMTSNVNSAMVSRPNSSGGGTSGFSSGGGFSGGGFGGGGGGSW